MLSEADHDWMERALALAANGLWTTTPNPRVGCVVVAPDGGAPQMGAGSTPNAPQGDSGGRLLGEGWHLRAGEPHAEVIALRQAGAAARGATVYVTLEPCAHEGRTPPCAPALIAAGVKRVVVAMEDPNPLVAGRGLAQLRAAGIEVRCGVLEREARELNLGFCARMTRGRPWVRLKLAASLDGATALPDGRSQWITSAAARADGHAWRARACAILTGIGTVRADDPRLTIRDWTLPATVPGSLRQPLRIVIDSRLEIDPQAKLVRAGGLLLVHALEPQWLQDGALAEKARLLQDHGVELCAISRAPNGKVDLRALMDALAQRGLNEVHVEAGAALNASLVSAGVVDELLVYLAPSLLGEARAMFKMAAPSSLDDRLALQFHAVDRVGEDLRILARFRQQSVG